MTKTSIKDYRKHFFDLMEYPDNPYHPLVWINGNPKIGTSTYIGGFADINSNGASLTIGANCDISSFTAINVASSHRLAIGLDEEPSFKDIVIGDYVFVGSHTIIMGGTSIGSRSVVAAGTVLRGEVVPPCSLAIGNPCVIKESYYRAELEAKGILDADLL